MFLSGCRLELCSWRKRCGCWVASGHVVVGQDVFDILSLINEQGTGCYVVLDPYTEDPRGWAKIRHLESSTDGILNRIEGGLIISGKKLVINVDRYDDN